MNPLQSPTHTSLKFALAWVFALCLLLCQVSPLSSQVSPEDAAAAEEHSRLGVEYYNADKLPEAVREMVSAYRLVKEAGLLYNIARIYQKMEEWDLAIDYYKKYVAHEEADPDTVQKALVHMKTIRSAQEEAASETLPDKSPEPPEPSPTPQPAPVVTEPAPIPAEEPGQLVAWVVTGAGAAMLTTGAVLGVLAMSAGNDVEDETLSFSARVDARDSGEQLALYADLAAVAGGLAVGTGLLLFALDEEQDPAEQTALELKLDPRGAVGANLRFSFD